MFSTRLEPEVLAQLKASAADWPGENVSAFTEFLINRGLAEREKQKRDQALRALLYCIAQLAERCGGIPTVKARWNWRTDPFLFRAFKLAVRKFLDALEEPSGEIKPPWASMLYDSPEKLEIASTRTSSPELFKYIVNQMMEDSKSPENYATYAFTEVWRQANNPAPEPDEYERAIFQALPFGKALEREFYGLPKALRDLELKSKPAAKPEDDSND
jgi:hypothetical protein